MTAAALPPLEKNIKNAILNKILWTIEQMVKEKIHLNWDEGSRRKFTYGISKQVLDKHCKANPWINQNLVNYYKKQTTSSFSSSKKQAAVPVVNVSVHTGRLTVLSDLSSSMQNSLALSSDSAAAGGDPSLSGNDLTVNNGNHDQTVNNDPTVNNDLTMNQNSSDKSRTTKIGG